MRVAILGGGITGLVCAYYAQRAGLQPTVLEATENFGFLSQRVRRGSQELDCFHSPISRQDHALRGLLAELGLLHRVVWSEVDTSVYQDGSVHPVDARDFPPLRGLPRLDRLRARIASLICSHGLQLETKLHRIGAREWLTRYYGARTYERVWSPVLRARFGENEDEIPAFVVWRFLRGIFAERSEPQGYLMGGHRTLCERLRQSLVERGGSVRFSTPVRGVQFESQEILISTDAGIESFGAAISTLAVPDLAKIAPAEVLSSLPQCDLEQRGVTSAVALLKRPLELPYRVIDVDGTLGFEQIVCAGRLVPASALGSLWPVYLARHCGVHSEAFRASDEVVTERARAALRKLVPDLADADVETIGVYRAPHVNPMWRAGAGAPRLPVRVGRSRLSLCTATQPYPREAGSETSVVLAREAIRQAAQGIRD